MPTSTRFAVALHLMVALALHPGEPLGSDQLASSANTNPVVVRRLLAMLARVGLTHSRMGARGGALLNRSPESINLLEIYQAVEDPELFGLPRCQANQECLVGRGIAPLVRSVTARAQGALESELASISLASVVEKIVPCDK